MFGSEQELSSAFSGVNPLLFFPPRVRGVFQYGLWQFGHTLGNSPSLLFLGAHSCLQRLQTQIVTLLVDIGTLALYQPS